MAAPLETTQVPSGDALAEKIAAVIDADVKKPDAHAASAKSAEETAKTIDDLFKQHTNSDDDDDNNVEEFLYTLWDVVLKSVVTIPATDPRLARLVHVVAALSKMTTAEVVIWEREMKVWADLPMLGPALREAWNTKPDDTEQDHTVLQKWLSLNSFAARLLGHRLQTSFTLALWELRAALEETHDDEAARDWHLGTASEWLNHAGEQLHRLSTIGSSTNNNNNNSSSSSSSSGGLDAQQVSMTSAAPLAPSGLEGGPSLQRWAFWKARLGQLSRELSHETREEGLKERVEGVMSKMNSIQQEQEEGGE